MDLLLSEIHIIYWKQSICLFIGSYTSSRRALQFFFSSDFSINGTGSLNNASLKPWSVVGLHGISFSLIEKETGPHLDWRRPELRCYPCQDLKTREPSHFHFWKWLTKFIPLFMLGFIEQVARMTNFATTQCFCPGALILSLVALRLCFIVNTPPAVWSTFRPGFANLQSMQSVPDSSDSCIYNGVW